VADAAALFLAITFEKGNFMVYVSRPTHHSPMYASEAYLYMIIMLNGKIYVRGKLIMLAHKILFMFDLLPNSSVLCCE
jgi:hypothetical protein